MVISKRVAIILLLSLLFVSNCTSSNEPPRDEMVNIGTHSLHINCLGTGNPTIVTDTGVGETYESREAVIAQLSSETRVCAYERAGYGQSEPGPMPRDGQRAADELHLLLAGSGETGPFLLIGHSLGGLNMQIYADSYKEEVAGLVLLDPSPLAWITGEGFPDLRELFIQQTISQREEADKIKTSSDPEALAIAGFMDATASEFEEFFGRTADEVAAIESFGEFPMVVIGASEPEPAFGDDGPAFRQFWNEESQALTLKSASGQFILAEGSSHHIHLDAPQLIIDAVLEILE